MPSSCCSVPLCTKRGGHAFPKDIELKKKWLEAIKRENWTPSKFSVVCKDHFLKSDFNEITYYGLIPIQQSLKKGTVPSVFSWPKEMTVKKATRKPRKSRRRLKRTKLKKIIPISKPEKKPVVQDSVPKATCPQLTSTVKHVTTVPLSVKSVCPSPSSPSIVNSPKVESKGPAQGLQVPKESLAGKLVVNSQSCMMPNPETLLRMLKLPPNVMFHINATSTKVFQKAIPKPATTSILRPDILEKTPPTGAQLAVKPPSVSIVEKVSKTLPHKPSDILIPKCMPIADTHSKWKKKEQGGHDGSVQGAKDGAFYRLIEPIVEMHLVSEEQTVNDTKKGQSVEVKDVKQEPVVSLVKQKLAVKNVKQKVPVKDVKTEQFNDNWVQKKMKTRKATALRLRRSTRMKRTSVKMNDI